MPGPGKYPLVSEWPEKAKLKAHYSKRSTFIQDIFRKEKKEKRPAPGSYNLFKSLKQQQQEAQNHSARKRDAGDRLTYLDSVQFDAIANPGVGKYNIRVIYALFRDDLRLRWVFQNTKQSLKTGGKNTASRL